MAHVVCVGISVYDIVLRLDAMPIEPIKHYAHGRSETTGGIAANAARAVVRLGGRAVLGSRIGNDLAGRSVLAELEREGVDVGAVHVLPSGRTSLSAVLIDAAGERLLVNDSDPATLRGSEGVPFAAIDRADALLADTRWAEGALHAVLRARQRGIPRVLDFDRTPDFGGAGELVREASHIVFGRQGLTGFTGHDDPVAGLNAVRAMTDAWLAVTRSHEGIWWLDPEGTARHMPVFRVEVVDTLAAGDIFHGAFALALAQGMDEPAALRFANAAAAIKCTRPGGGLGAPRLDEVLTFLKEHP